eukprot:CAMPEP_0171564760 /NCGR_PEP_ID=MMETSP0960-20121227/16481_1 /TAXON_ID=87120 /ORGANISM="Aurantiochytrium limacinum, Strain ATCCMYA-1381" /LENGTH=149 /DNA_ID=CAMNT_0012118207 /DNA_START=661 /DNA_END=1110 /DNA_ORIENTATION=+
MTSTGAWCNVISSILHDANSSVSSFRACAICSSSSISSAMLSPLFFSVVPFTSIFSPVRWTGVSSAKHASSSSGSIPATAVYHPTPGPLYVPTSKSDLSQCTESTIPASTARVMKSPMAASLSTRLNMRSTVEPLPAGKPSLSTSIISL